MIGVLAFDSTSARVSVTPVRGAKRGRQLSVLTAEEGGMSYSFFGGQLNVSNLSVALAMTQSFSASGQPSESSNAGLGVRASGLVHVGGKGGFEAILGGDLGVGGDGSARVALTIDHVGGWSPVSGSLAPCFTTPAFSGSLAFGSDSSIALSASAQWLKNLTIIDDLLVITAHPASGAPGATLSVSLERPDGSTPFEYAVGFTGGLRLGPNTSGIPLFEVTGSLVSSDTSTCA